MSVATLWDDAFAPVTSNIGFLQSPIKDVVDYLAAWRTAIHGSVQQELLAGGLRENLRRLEPLTLGVRPRELLVATTNPEWTAVFDCGAFGGDPVTTIGYLARTMPTRGVMVSSIPDRRAGEGTVDRFGARQLEIYGPVATEFLNYVRTLSLVRDGARWRFDAAGVPQEFEDLDAYDNRKLTERFTEQMLLGYTAALGLEPFNEHFYPGPSVLMTSPSMPRLGSPQFTIQDARKHYGIDPA